MTTITINVTSTFLGFPLTATDGASVDATLPTGCVLRYSDDMADWHEEVRARPFTHTGEARSYRVDCDVYTSPVTATLTVGD